MRMCAQAATILFLGAAGIGCGGARTRPVDASFAKFVGVYRFAQQVNAETYLDGRFHIEADTIDVELKSSSCQVQTVGSRVQAIAYTCGTDVAISFDRVNPITRASYLVQVTTLESRTVCVRYATGAYGRQVCAESRVETTPRRRVLTGRLRPERMENADWGTGIAAR